MGGKVEYWECGGQGGEGKVEYWECGGQGGGRGQSRVLGM